MKTLASFMILFLLAGFCVAEGETRENPVAVSPGSETGLATVSHLCPTFSWSAVDRASSYWIAVFQSPDAIVRSYADIAVIASPLIVKEIAGPALSWTLPAEERLLNGVLYAWYVQAVGAGGNRLGSCSTGRIFKVEQEAAWAGMDGKIEELLRSHGVSEDVIIDTMKDWKPSVTDASVRSALAQKPSKMNGNGTEGTTITHFGRNEGFEGMNNTFYGWGAGTYTTTGLGNTFIGAMAGYYNTTGDYNTFLGYNAGINNTTGDYNTFLGLAAGQSNTTGTYNAFLGDGAGQGNTSGVQNTFLGRASGYSNTTGYENTFLGHGVGYSNTTGHENTFIGNSAGYSNTTASYNTFHGHSAGYSITTGSVNTFLGRTAGFSNTTGGRNTFLGAGAGYYNTTGYQNTYLGDFAGIGNNTGYGNTFIGNEAGANETDSNKLYIDNSNTSDPLIYGEFDNRIVNINGKLGIGTKTPGYPLEIVTTGAKASIVVGRPDGAKNWMNATTAFGNFGTVNNYPLRLQVNSVGRMTLYNNNSVMMANGASLSAGGVWTDASSIALKENISSLGSNEAATTLLALNPVKYNYKAAKEENHVGFIAEEVPDLVAMKDRKSLSPMDIVAVLTKVTQDLQKQNQDQQNQLQEQKQFIQQQQDVNEKLTRKMQEQQQITQEQQQINEKMKKEIADLKKIGPE